MAEKVAIPEKAGKTSDFAYRVSLVQIHPWFLCKSLVSDVLVSV